MKKLIITIDGFAGTGKGTTASGVAKKLGYIHLDTGAFYRVVTLYFLQEGVGYNDVERVVSELKNIDIKMEYDDENGTNFWLNGKLVSDEIRKQFVTEKVFYYAQITEIRAFLNEKFREIGKNGGVILDARDASKIFPDADLKIFLEADLEVKAERRWKEYQAKGEDISLEEVKRNFQERDKIDANNTVIYPDSVVIDTSDLTIDGQVGRVLDLVGRIKR